MASPRSSERSPSWFSRSESKREHEQQLVMEATHKKRLAMILRYIATMHHSAANQHDGFVRSEVTEADAKRLWRSNYFRQVHVVDAADGDHDETSRVLFSTADFARLVIPNASSAPFSFYAANDDSKRKRTLTGTLKDSITLLSSSNNNNPKPDDRACWLRLTRMPKESSPPTVTSSAVRDYLVHWKSRSNATSFKSLLTLENLQQRAPKLAPGNSLDRQEIKSFLRRYKKYLIRKKSRSNLEPMYNQLFEWLQHHGSHNELVWGFGNAKLLQDTTVVNGPLLEVLVEVELARDGALLVRPRPHTGVSLNRQVVSAICQDGAHADLLSTLYKTVAEMETSQLSPGQPATYTPLLKRMAVQLAPNGSFVSLSSEHTQGMDGLVVTDSWCLYCRPKPSTVWARDASDLADQLLLPNLQTNLEQGALSKATLALTHGPSALEGSFRTKEASSSSSCSEKGVLQSIKKAMWKRQEPTTSAPLKPLFALPTSDSQDLIADLLLSRHVPAVVCEGPPGTGKTHTIANIVCAYLCQGKRVCVTSKGAPALSVLRQRLPPSVQELCVDVSMSESTGMRQLQQTVERLADRVSCVNTDVQTEKCRLLKQNIDELENELRDTDAKLEAHSEAQRRLLTSPSGQELAETSLMLISSAPYLVKTLAKWSLAETRSFYDRAESIVKQQDSIDLVDGFDSPPSDTLVSSVAAEAGAALSVVRTRALKTVASMPGLGSLSGLSHKQAQVEEAMSMLRVDGNPPQTRAEWQLVLVALNHDKNLHTFHDDVLDAWINREGWPADEIYMEHNGRRRISQRFLELVGKALRLKELARMMNAEEELKESIECGLEDARRSKITSRIQFLAESMVEATVVTELRRTFSVEAQSALIKFAQIAGKSRFSKSSQPSKMSQRQRRHRQEYLEAFERCVRYTPCWVLTSSQVSDYLPSESGLFDLVVIDEASQSDITVLPGMLRGKQWLIVGDGKQVSPTESFISEAQIDSLKASLPESPLADSLLPGQSFFDLCAQAFPRGRVVLSEHFRCAPEIIACSNSHFYDGRLIPLRLPTTSERMTPSIVDVRINGKKVGKINEKECDTIVSMIQELVDDPGPRPRSIGVISLMGDEQSRLIRGRVLDGIGPAKYKEHEILIGDPPTFQGAERDVIFLSLVCSVGSVPTQNQQMHAQRANVALSRARDRMVLVRSIDASHIPNGEDVKGPIIDFFESSGLDKNEEAQAGQVNVSSHGLKPKSDAFFSFRNEAEGVLEKLLIDSGFSVRRMGVVWNDALCVENDDSGLRAAVCIDCACESKEEWRGLFSQQKSIERVGWRCLRVDALSVFVDLYGTFEIVTKFLASAGVETSRASEPLVLADESSEMGREEHINNEANGQNDDDMSTEQEVVIEIDDDAEDNVIPNVNSPAIVVISSDDDGEEGNQRLSDQPDSQEPRIKMEPEEGLDPGQFGDVVDLAFLRNERNPSRDFLLEQDESIGSDGEEDSDTPASGKKRKSRVSDNDEAYLGGTESDESESSINGRRARRRRKRSRRLDKYSRDARWYPDRKEVGEDDYMGSWYDTDSDLAPDTVKSSKETATVSFPKEEQPE